MSQPQEHLQGLQIPSGVLSGRWESSGWIATFIIREAILVCPDNLNTSEEYMYFSGVSRVVEDVIAISRKEAGGATYRTPYLLRACANVLNQFSGSQSQITKEAMLKALYIDEDILRNEPDIIVNPIRLTSGEIKSLKASRSSMFWFEHLATFQSDRQQEGRPLLTIFNPNLHKRSGLWEHIYSRSVMPVVFHTHDSQLYDMDDTPASPQRDTSVAPFHAQTGSDTELAKMTNKRSRDDVNRVQASAVEGEPLPKPDRDDVPLAKRRKAMLAEKSSPSAKVSLPVSRQPARRDKAAGPSGSNGKDATSQNSDVPNKNKVIAIDGKQVVTKKGEAIADDAIADANAKQSSLPKADVRTQTGLGEEVVEKAKRVLRSGKKAAPDSLDNESFDNESGYYSDNRTPQKGMGGDFEDNMTHVASGADLAGESATKKAPKNRKVAKVDKSVAELISESFKKPQSQRDWKLVTYDKWEKVLPVVWFYLHPFAEEFLDEQFAPAACDSCVRGGNPCVIFLKSFVGCYACKSRSVYCSLGAGIDGKGPNNKPLAWWITLLHHICSVIELGKPEGCVSVLPNYADVSLNEAKMPRWASRASSTIRKTMSKEDIDKRWTHLQISVIPTWKFYAMPHSLLSSMGDDRPQRPYWPSPGEQEQDVIERGITILTQGKAGTLPRVWASRAKVDGYDFSPREEAKEAKVRQKKEDNSKQKKKEQENKVIPEKELADNETQRLARINDPVPSELYEAPTADTELPLVLEENQPMDVDVPSPSSPSMVDTDVQVQTPPPVPSTELAREGEKYLSDVAPPSRDSSPEDLRERPSSSRELASARQSIQDAIQILNEFRCPTFSQSQADPSLSTITALLHKALRNVNGLEIAIAGSDNEYRQVIVHSKTELRNKPPLDCAAESQATQEELVLDVLSRLDSVRQLLMSHASFAHATERQPSDNDPITSTSDLVPANRRLEYI